jgi:hypothetical protein
MLAFQFERTWEGARRAGSHWNSLHFLKTSDCLGVWVCGWMNGWRERCLCEELVMTTILTQPLVSEHPIDNYPPSLNFWDTKSYTFCIDLMIHSFTTTPIWTPIINKHDLYHELFFRFKNDTLISWSMNCIYC